MKVGSGSGRGVGLWRAGLLAGALANLLGGCRLDELMNPPPAVELPDSGPATTPDAAAGPEVVKPTDAGGTADAGGGPRPDGGADRPDAIADRPGDTAPAPETGPPAPPDVAPPPPPDVAPPPVDLAPPPDPLVVGLVARWRFDEGQGTRADDDTGNGNVAALHNGAAWQPSPVTGGNTAVHLDGVDDFISATTSTIPAVEARKSIAYWLGTAAFDPDEAGQRSCVALYSAMPRSGVQVGFDRGRPAAWFRGQARGLVVAPAVPVAGLHHIAYTFDGQTHRLYVDGVAAGSASDPPPAGKVTSLTVGTYEVPNEMCGGVLDDLRIYDRALSADEARRLAGR
jgi:hypothetical protein